MADVLDGYAFHLVCRLGIAANVPKMTMGELGFDTDTRVLRIGNDTAAPEKVMTNNSTTAFEYPSVPSVKFNDIELYSGATVGGVDLSALTEGTAGLLAVNKSGKLSVVSLISGDSSITISNPTGLLGNPDIRKSDPTITIPVWITVWAPDIFESDELIYKMNVVETFTLPKNLTGSRAVLEIEPMSSALFHIYRNAVEIGTIYFDTGAVVGTFSFNNDVEFINSDVFYIVVDSSTDDKAASLSVTFLGSR